MSYVWQQRTESFPTEESPQLSVHDLNHLNQLNHDEDNDNPNNGDSQEMRESPTFEPKKFIRMRDSVFIARRRSRSSITGKDDSESGFSDRPTSVRFTDSTRSSFSQTQAMIVDGQAVRIEKGGVNNPVFVDDSGRGLKNQMSNDTSNHSSPFNDNKEMENFVAFYDIADDGTVEPLTPGSVSEPVKRWDAFVSLPKEDDDETLDSKMIGVFLKVLKVIAYFLTFIVVLVCAALSKSIVLLMSSMINPNNRTVPICNNRDITGISNEHLSFKAVLGRDDPERIAWIWCLLFILVTPEIFTFLRSLRICLFKIYKTPFITTFIWIFTIETLQSIGTVILIFHILPLIDSTRGLVLMNTFAIVPGILGIMSRPSETRKGFETIIDMLSMIVQIGCLIVWPILSYYKDKDRAYYWTIPISAFFISLGWWENYVNDKANNRLIKGLAKIKKEFHMSRYFTLLFISLWKIIVIFGSMLFYYYISDGGTMVKNLFTKFNAAFDNHDIRIQRVEDTNTSEEYYMHAYSSAPLWISLAQVAITWFCYIFGRFACKICIQSIGFAFPINLTVPLTISFLTAMCGLQYQDKCLLTDFFHPFQYIFWNCENQIKGLWNESFFNWHMYIWIVSYLTQMWLCIHIWTSNSERLAPSDKLFIKPFYSSVFVDQSLAFNRRRDDNELNEESDLTDAEGQQNHNDYYEPQGMTKGIADFYESGNDDPILTFDAKGYTSDDYVTRIFACATMWHETGEEMIQFLKSVMRLDEDQCARRNAKEWLNVSSTLTEYYEIETHIFFDDAFEQGEDDDDEDSRVVNSFVKKLVEVIDDAASNVHQRRIKIRSPKRIPTPYGGRLEWTLPGQNKLFAHLKDKNKIRHRKRWSQVMYMYYLLGHRIAAEPIEESRKKIRADNTYLLALDGDINFRPHAVHLLVDHMKKNKNLGAACGRIHPIGSGPMVWYQLFEYAISHWLQKATEHMIGCVLCSPGCFSLFRARALMDSNVMHRYTTVPTEALHYVQYDQGEDRWLCTLLLQQGWRVEYSAASDSYTHSPEGFGEFYTQRRRWAPSTMANIMDLLKDYKNTVRVNENISSFYMLYQAGLMLGTVLSPGTIFLMLVGAVNTAFSTSAITSFSINLVPLMCFILICFFTKNNIQILAAQILSTVYALLMLAVFVSTGIEISQEGLLSPSAFFFTSIMATFIIAAIIHPQEFYCIFPSVLYLLVIPSMYLLLTLYSIINLHVVTWGTREVKAKLSAKERLLQQQQQQSTDPKKKKGLFGWLPHSDALDLNKSNWGCSCLCCSEPKGDEEKVHLKDIKSTLNTFTQNIANLNSTVNNIQVKSSIRRGSFRRSARFSEQLETVSEISDSHPLLDGYKEDDDDDTDDTDDEIPIQENKENEQKQKSKYSNESPEWVHEKELKSGPILQLPLAESSFWTDLIEKYLKPIDENPQQQAKIRDELIELRNRVVFAFGMINSLFILFVFLLQMHRDVFHINWPISSYYNHTYNEELEIYQDKKVYNYIQMDPIGLVLVAFFGAIMIVQVIGMFFHRFGTLAHLLAFTDLDCCTRNETMLSEENLVDHNAVQFAKELQRLKDYEETEQRRSVAEDNAFGQTQRQPLRLDLVFRKRLMSIKDDTNIFENSPNLEGLRRKSTFAAIINRRNTMIDIRRKSIGAYLHMPNDILMPQINESRPVSMPIPKPRTSLTGSVSINITPPPVYNEHDNEQIHDNIEELETPEIREMSDALSAAIIKDTLMEIVNNEIAKDMALMGENQLINQPSSDSSNSLNNVHLIEAEVYSDPNLRRSHSSSSSVTVSHSDNDIIQDDESLSTVGSENLAFNRQNSLSEQNSARDEYMWNIPVGETRENLNIMTTKL